MTGNLSWMYIYMFSILGGLGLGVGAWYYIYKFVQKCVFIFFYLDPIFEKKVLKNNFKNKCSLMQCTSQFFFPAQREITRSNQWKMILTNILCFRRKKIFSLQKDVDQYMTLSFLKWKSQATFVPDQTYFLVWHFKIWFRNIFCPI